MRSPLPPEIVHEVEVLTGSTLTGFASASGGCINQGGTCKTKDSTWFLKWNDRKKYPQMFEAEAYGLSLLKRSTSLHVPSVTAYGNAGPYQFLLLENITSASRAPHYWRYFGIGLAELHGKSADEFGLDHDNYIGSLPQSNVRTSSWSEFFIEQRLMKQLRLAIDEGKLDHSHLKKFEIVFRKMDTLVTSESPALLHGDLWGGNIMTNGNGMPTLIDPAIYFGNREVDLAMTALFGGFDPKFFGYYDEVYPLAAGYHERFDLYNLYPLLVHVNLFGGGYARQVETVLNRFV